MSLSLFLINLPFLHFLPFRARLDFWRALRVNPELLVKLLPVLFLHFDHESSSLEVALFKVYELVVVDVFLPVRVPRVLLTFIECWQVYTTKLIQKNNAFEKSGEG